jgi:cell wall-associated NlpC family hydrolase
MSFSDAIGQIDQIVQWEQQLEDPAAAAQTTSTGGVSDATAADAAAAGATSSTGAASSSAFADALASAQAEEEASAATTLDPTDSSDDSSLDSSDLLGGGDSQLLASLSSFSSSSATATTDTAGSIAGSALTANVTTDSGPAGGIATSAADPRIQAMTEEANALVGKPYVWGGGHNGWGPSTGYDCSGFVSAVLHAGGYLGSPQDTETLPTASGIESGPGQYVTIYDRDEPGKQGHVIIEINGQFYESGGQQGSWGGGGGVQQISTPSAGYLATFNTVLHPAGL